MSGRPHIKITESVENYEKSSNNLQKILALTGLTQTHYM